MPATGDQRPGQHAVETFDANLAVKSDSRQMGEAVGIVRVSLVRRHVEMGLGMARIDADRGQSFRRQCVIELHGYATGAITAAFASVSNTKAQCSDIYAPW